MVSTWFFTVSTVSGFFGHGDHILGSRVQDVSLGAIDGLAADILIQRDCKN